MWKWLHPYAKADRAYQLCNTLLPYFAVVTVVCMIVGWVWGLAYAPADYQQKDSYRIIFIHVPSAILSMGAYSSMAIAAVIALVWQLRNAELAVIAIAPVGACVTAIALITGAAWGKPCGAHGGCGMRVLPLSSFCYFYTWVCYRFIMLLKIKKQRVVPPVF